MRSTRVRMLLAASALTLAVGAPMFGAWRAGWLPATATEPHAAGPVSAPADADAGGAVTVAKGGQASADARAAAPPPAPASLAPAYPIAAIDEPLPQRADAAALRQAIEAYRKGDVTEGDTAAANAFDPLGVTTLEWAALRLQPRAAGHQRLGAFIDANPDWPAGGFLQSRLEDALYTSRAPHDVVRARFAQREPATPTGRMALARALEAAGDVKAAAALMRKTWREEDFGTWAETAIRKEFGGTLTVEDHRFRSARLFHKGQHAASLRAAALVSNDYEALAKARSAVAQDAASEKLMAAVPPTMRNDPTFSFARVQILRRAGKLTEAAEILTQMRNAPDLVDPGAWWDERKMIARRLLDAGQIMLAYAVAAHHAAVSSEDRIDAEFHAGWIALRFAGDAPMSAQHFAQAHTFARTPISLARTTYWQGRAAEAQGRHDQAADFYKRASEHSSAYYGQLARARLGLHGQPVRKARKLARGDERSAPVRAVEVFESIGERDLSFRLTMDLARALDDEAQIAALAQIHARAGNARAALMVGKLASQRGISIDDAAFPIFGVPNFDPLPGAADQPIVYAIARQESSFQPDAVSHAGAKGLMQMLTSTARVTARRAGVPFDERRLLTDPAFNAQLGSAHLGELLGDYGNSMILTFAAYNAGGPRVRQWIQAYGDPRHPHVDPIDWVERIPFTETRNYVQRVAENLTMYRARFGAPDAPALAARDLRAQEARLALR